tara:strand:- start:23 stop:445 length:423 start_codon:yes stop_codon:yes gene_type:complete
MKKLLITFAAVLTLIGCSPEEQSGFEQSISSTLTSQTSWLSDMIGGEDNEYIFGYTFRSNDNGSLDFSALIQQPRSEDCLKRIGLVGNPTIEVYIDRVVMTTEDNQSFTFTIEGNLLKMTTDQGYIFFKPDSVTLQCDSW